MVALSTISYAAAKEKVLLVVERHDRISSLGCHGRGSSSSARSVSFFFSSIWVRVERPDATPAAGWRGMRNERR